MLMDVIAVFERASIHVDDERGVRNNDRRGRDLGTQTGVIFSTSFRIVAAGKRETLRRFPNGFNGLDLASETCECAS